MKLIVGLGNPGNEYNFTRHNYGFLALDFYAKVHNLAWQKEKNGAIWLKDGDRILIKPQGFYNNSGIAVANYQHFYKVAPTDILVICDDFELPFGKIRYREHGSSGGNNGLKSIAQHLRTEAFPRLRLGTNNPPLRQKFGDIEFVLGRFTTEERKFLPQVLQEAIKRINESL